MTKINKKVIIMVAVAIMLVAIPITYSFYNSSDSVPNYLATKALGLGIDEEFIHGQDILPGEHTDKKVKFINVEDTDLLLRVKVSEAWYKGDEIYSDASVDEMIKKWTSVWPTKEIQTNDWIKINDYYYYKHIFKGKTKTDLILESLQLSPEVSNDTHAIDYSELTYKLTFDAEGSRVNEYQVKKMFGEDITFVVDGDNVTWSEVTNQ